MQVSGYTDLADPAQVQGCIDGGAARRQNPYGDVILIEWQPILYSRGGPVMSPAATVIVDELLCQILLAGGVELIGHTDTVGNANDNMALSLEVAGEVRDSMVAQGIDPAVIHVEGRGETELVIPTEDDVAKQSNRRIQYVLPL